MNSVVCEGEELVLQCSADSRLAVYSVVYGSTAVGAVQCAGPVMGG